jgi:type I restriction-modification system DNA methylase subunit
MPAYSDRELMAEESAGLISMADIARLANQSRATVGNWKARNPDDFPPERGRSVRGPLYDRAEVIEWLGATNRLGGRSPSLIWEVVNRFRETMSIEDTRALLLVFLAVIAKDPEEWWQLRTVPTVDLDRAVRSLALKLFPFAGNLFPENPLPLKPTQAAVEMLADTDVASVADMAESLFEQAASASRGGEFRTPRSVRSLMVGLVEPTGTLYNPATGAGQLMVESVPGWGPRLDKVCGQEVDPTSWAMAQLNLAIHSKTKLGWPSRTDFEADVALGDVFTEDRFPKLQADRVLCSPPWFQRLRAAEALAHDPRWVWGEPGPNDADEAWIQHCLAHLADRGRAVILLPERALFAKGRAGRIRQRIIKAGLLDAVIGLPAGLFAWTNMPASILVFEKGRIPVDGKPAPILMVDLADKVESRRDRSASLRGSLVDEVVSIYHEWTRGVRPSVDFASTASYDEVAANEFVIDPARYLVLLVDERDLGEVTRTHADLVARLSLLTRASRTADSRLESVLREPQ